MFRFSILMILIATPAMAQNVPSECVNLALKHGFSATNMGKEEARKAERKLQWLRVTRPFNTEIRDCKKAVELLKANMK